MSDKEKLLPCPCCGKRPKYKSLQLYDVTYYQIYCNLCGLYTRNFVDKTDALKYWNTRHTPEKRECDCLISEYADINDGTPDISGIYKSCIKDKKHLLKVINIYGLSHFCSKCGQDLKPFYDSVLGE